MEILSQKEIDDLINSLALGQPQLQAGKPMPEKKRLRVYDFKRPDKFSKDQLRTLQLLHENLTRSLTTFFAAHFRTNVSLAVTSVDQLTYAEVLKDLPEPTVIAIFRLEPLQGNAMLELSPSLTFPIIDRLLGGPGYSSDKLRALTEIELTVIQRIIVGFLDNLKEAWSGIISLQPHLEVIETNPMFAQIVAGNEMVVLITFAVTVGGHTGAINLCLPYIVLEPVMPKLSAHHWFTIKQEVSPELHQRMRANLEELKVEVRVELGEVQLTIGEFLQLQAGDVVQLDTKVKDELKVYVGNKPKFAAYPGRRGRKLGVRVSRLLE